MAKTQNNIRARLENRIIEIINIFQTHYITAAANNCFQTQFVD